MHKQSASSGEIAEVIVLLVASCQVQVFEIGAELVANLFRLRQEFRMRQKVIEATFAHPHRGAGCVDSQTVGHALGVRGSTRMELSDLICDAEIAQWILLHFRYVLSAYFPVCLEDSRSICLRLDSVLQLFGVGALGVVLL